jgi:hypothetical protein
VAGLAVLLAALALVAGQPQPEALPPFDPSQPLTEREKAQRLERVVPEQSSPDQVRRLLGEPARKARQILYHRAREQWCFEAPFHVRLEFEYVRGQEPHLLSVQRPNAGKP